MVKRNYFIELEFCYYFAGQEKRKNYQFPMSKNALFTYEILRQYKEKFLNEFLIKTDGRMYYLTTQQQEIQITEHFQISLEDFQAEHECYLFIIVQSSIKILNETIIQLEQRLDKIKQQIDIINKSEYQNKDIRKTHSENFQKLRKSSSFIGQSKYDIGFLYSQPCDGQQPVNFRQQLQKIKNSLKRSHQNQIVIKSNLATMNRLKSLIIQNVKILHIMCHGDIDKTTKDTYLCFEEDEKIGQIRKLYTRQIQAYLSQLTIEKPKVAFINACHSQKIGDAFLNGGIPYVIVIESTESIDDTAAQMFAQKFYLHLFNGYTVRQSFEFAKDNLNRMNRPINSIVCCCNHSKHYPKCKWTDQVKKYQKSKEYDRKTKPQQNFHSIYHIPTCKCIKSHLNRHELNCQWAIKTLFQINYNYQINQNGESRSLTEQQIAQKVGKQNKQLLVCCCNCPHDQIQKFKFKCIANKQDQILFPKQYQQPQHHQVQIIDFTPSNLLLQKNIKVQKLTERRSQIFSIIKEICIKQKKKLGICGVRGSGRTSVALKVGRYLYQRQIFKDNISYMDLVNCRNNEQFKIILSKKMKIINKGCVIEQILESLKQKQILFILDNCQLFFENQKQQFVNLINLMNLKLPDSKIFIIFDKKSAQEFKKKLLITCFQLTPIQPKFVIKLIYQETNQFTSDLTYFQITQLFKQEHSRIPKNILQIIYHIKSNHTQYKKANFATIKKYISELTQYSGKFLQQKIEKLKKTESVYRLFLFISLFPDGLTKLDFSIMSSQIQQLQGQQTQNKIISQVPYNWIQLIKQMLQTKEADPFGWQQTQPPKTDKTDEVKQNTIKQYYFCTIQKKQHGYSKIKIKNNILDYLKTKDFYDEDLKFNFLIYLSTFSTILIKIFKQKYYYHERYLEYSTISNSGFFQFEKSSKFMSYFDQGDYFPDIQNMTQSIRKGSKVENQLKYIFQANKELKEIHPSKLIFEHQSNFFQIYLNDNLKLYNDLKTSTKKKLFKYYFQNVLLNIPTLIKITNDKKFENFYSYYLIESKNQLLKFSSEFPKSNIIFIIKLILMSYVYQIESYKQNKNEQINIAELQQTRNIIFMNFKQLIKQLAVSENDQINKILDLESYFLKNYILYQSLKKETITQKFMEKINKILINSHNFNEKYQSIIYKSQQTKLLKYKYTLLYAKIYALIRKKQKNYFFLQKFDHNFDLSNIIQMLSTSIIQFQQRKLKLIEVQARLILIELKFQQIEKSSHTQDLTSSMAILKQQTKLSALDHLIKCQIITLKQILKRKQFNLNAKQIQHRLIEIEEKINKTIFEETKNFLIFMKADPIVQKNQIGNISQKYNPYWLNTIRRTHNFKDNIQRILRQQKSNNSLACYPKNKQVSLKFQILTQKKMIDTVSKGCLILVLTINAVIQQDQVYLLFQNQASPTVNKQNLKKIIEKAFKSIKFLVICGQNAQIVVKKIKQLINPYPTMIFIDYIIKSYPSKNQFFYDHYEQFSIQALQRIAGQNFLQNLCINLIDGKIENFQSLKTKFEQVQLKTRFFMDRFSKHTQNLKQIIKFGLQFHKQQSIKLYFQKGSFHNISTPKSKLNNVNQLKQVFVGRQQYLIQIMELLIQYSQNKQSCYINIYGNNNTGKSKFITQLAYLLIERQYFKSGIYILKGKQIQKNFKGDIYDYLQHKKNQIFTISYLNERKIDASNMLIIIDDFEAVKHSNYLDYFLQSMYTQGTHFILTSFRKLTKQMIPKFENRKLNSIQLKKLNKEQISLLIYTYISLFDYESCRNKCVHIYEKAMKTNQTRLNIQNLIKECQKQFKNEYMKTKNILKEKYKFYKLFYQNRLGISFEQQHSRSNESLETINTNKKKYKNLDREHFRQDLSQ